MSMTSALSNALSGLTAASRAADLISSNVANALTEGYGRRTLEVSARSLAGTGGGVRIDAVRRQVDIGVLSDRRTAEAVLAASSVTTDFLAGLEDVIGSPEDAWSLSGRMAGMESAAISAASLPVSNARLSTLLRSATDLASHIGDISDHIQQSRGAADRQIAAGVTTINDALGRIEKLNGEISVALFKGNDAASLMDQRQQQVDRISEWLPLREVAGDHGTIALFTPQGTTLLDGKAQVLGFSAANVITPELSLASGALSGLTINGVAVNVTGSNSTIAGGRMVAEFEVRDGLAVKAQTELDAFARDLVERFQSPATDPTLTINDAGLFTDAGALFDPLAEVGLSQRLAINAAADPAQGGALWHLRDGLLAASPGPVGDATGLHRLVAALQASRPPASGLLTGIAASGPGLAAGYLSIFATEHQGAEADLTYAAARYDTMKGLELQFGVDTDLEMQSLLLVEQAYNANAKVIQTVDGLLQALLEI